MGGCLRVVDRLPFLDLIALLLGLKVRFEHLVEAQLDGAGVATPLHLEVELMELLQQEQLDFDVGLVREEVQHQRVDILLHAILFLLLALPLPE